MMPLVAVASSTVARSDSATKCSATPVARIAAPLPTAIHPPSSRPLTPLLGGGGGGRGWLEPALSVGIWMLEVSRSPSTTWMLCG